MCHARKYTARADRHPSSTSPHSTASTPTPGPLQELEQAMVNTNTMQHAQLGNAGPSRHSITERANTIHLKVESFQHPRHALQLTAAHAYMSIDGTRPTVPRGRTTHTCLLLHTYPNMTHTVTNPTTDSFNPSDAMAHHMRGCCALLATTAGASACTHKSSPSMLSLPLQLLLARCQQEQSSIHIHTRAFRHSANKRLSARCFCLLMLCSRTATHCGVPTGPGPKAAVHC